MKSKTIIQELLLKASQQSGESGENGTIDVDVPEPEQESMVTASAKSAEFETPVTSEADPERSGRNDRFKILMQPFLVSADY